MSEHGKTPGAWPRRLVVCGLAALLPKCAACVAGYLALTAGVTTAAPELCGATTGAVIVPNGLAGGSIVMLLAGVSGWRWWRRASRRSQTL